MYCTQLVEKAEKVSHCAACVWKALNSVVLDEKQLPAAKTVTEPIGKTIGRPQFSPRLTF